MQMKTKLALFVGLVLLTCALMFIVYDGNTEPTITVEDGYLVVNGVKTEHKVHTEPTITVEDGYLVVNGVKTEYEVKNKSHSFGDWQLYNEGENDCEKKRYYRTCPDCSTIEWKEGKYEDHSWRTVTTQPTCQAGGYDTKTCATCGKVEICNKTSVIDHAYGTSYLSDKEYHWLKCANCSAVKNKNLHSLQGEGVCSVCDNNIGYTQGITYEVSNDGTYATVTGYTGESTIIFIANEYNGVPVKTIGSNAFQSKDVEVVIIPDGVKSIGYQSFSECSALTSLYLPNTLTSIADYAFYNCSSLTNINLPDSIMSIGDAAFVNCKSIKSINIPYGVTSLRYTFSGCTNLTNVNIPNSVTELGPSAFSSCTKLTNVDLPDSLTTISESAFWSCSSLVSVNIPSGVTSIGNSAFANCISLESINIPEGIKTIGKNVFNTCSRLESIEIPESVTGIELGAFRGCSALISISIPSSVTHIDAYAFTGCTKLVSIYVYNSVLSVGNHAFYNCPKLSTVYYSGSEEDWAKINLDASGNDVLASITIEYNYKAE